MASSGGRPAKRNLLPSALPSHNKKEERNMVLRNVLSYINFFRKSYRPCSVAINLYTFLSSKGQSNNTIVAGSHIPTYRSFGRCCVAID